MHFARQFLMVVGSEALIWASSPCIQQAVPLRQSKYALGMVFLMASDLWKQIAFAAIGIA